MTDYCGYLKGKGYLIVQWTVANNFSLGWNKIYGTVEVVGHNLFSHRDTSIDCVVFVEKTSNVTIWLSPVIRPDEM
ncbi:hypothetical protein D3OALGA1CA_4145 [Olavius algarvensis associated proteobacterium Delta 3]|nr:hypothetical protein D3OALGA1CA_4145 [Olavius algarvensis associated proteobacterium Delta 3]